MNINGIDVIVNGVSDVSEQEILNYISYINENNTEEQLESLSISAAADGNATKILLHGNIRADAAFPTLTIGSPVYVGETAGDIQVAIPTGADNVIRRVGYALTADELYFCPSMDSQITVA